MRVSHATKHCLFSHARGCSVCVCALICRLQIEAIDSNRKDLGSYWNWQLSLSPPLLLYLLQFYHTPPKVRYYVVPLMSVFYCVSFSLSQFFLLSLHVLFKLSSIAGTCLSIYNINIGSERLYWCPTAVPEKMTESFLKTLPPFLLCHFLFVLPPSFCPQLDLLVFVSKNVSFCFRLVVLGWRTVSTVTIAKNLCMAASTSSQMTVPTASPVTTACSQTHVMSAKNSLAMMQG